jgi:hypothetical protein
MGWRGILPSWNVPLVDMDSARKGPFSRRLFLHYFRCL